VLAPLNPCCDKRLPGSPAFTSPRPRLQEPYRQLVDAAGLAGRRPMAAMASAVSTSPSSEMSSAANHGFAITLLTHGAYSAILAGDPARGSYLPTPSFEWGGTINRTVAAVRHRPRPLSHQGGPAGRRDLQDLGGQNI